MTFNETMWQFEQFDTFNIKIWFFNKRNGLLWNSDP